MTIVLKYFNLINFLLLFGLLTVPLSAPLTRTVFLIIFISCLMVLAFLAIKKISSLNWFLLFASLFYLIFTAILRPDYTFITFRFLAVILTILVASHYAKICDTKDLFKLVKIIFVIGFFSAIFGLTQFLFGYSELDTYLLFFQGSKGVVEDFEKFNRSRSLGITFGALSQGILMGLTLHCIILLNKFEKKSYKKVFYIFSFFLVIFSLLATLNRTSIVATIASMLIYINLTNMIFFFKKISWIFKIFLFFTFAWLFLLILDLPEFEQVNIGLKAIFRAIGIYDNSEIVGDYFSRGKSFDIRLAILSNSMDMLMNNPFGIKESPRNFSIDDSGIASPLLKYGIIGGGFIVIIIFIPIIGLLKFYFSRKNLNSNNDIIKLIYGFYIITLITNIISFSFDGTIMMLPFWLIVFLGVYITMYNKKFDKF
jgi:hypothetical protein